jgi:hypothetical protein
MPTMSREPSFPPKDNGTLVPAVPASIADYRLLAVVAACPDNPTHEISLRLGFNGDHADRLLASTSGRAFVAWLRR